MHNLSHEQAFASRPDFTGVVVCAERIAVDKNREIPGKILRRLD